MFRWPRMHIFILLKLNKIIFPLFLRVERNCHGSQNISKYMCFDKKQILWKSTNFLPACLAHSLHIRFEFRTFLSPNIIELQSHSVLIISMGLSYFHWQHSDDTKLDSDQLCKISILKFFLIFKCHIFGLKCYLQFAPNDSSISIKRVKNCEKQLMQTRKMKIFE